MIRAASGPGRPFVQSSGARQSRQGRDPRPGCLARSVRRRHRRRRRGIVATRAVGERGCGDHGRARTRRPLNPLVPFPAAARLRAVSDSREAQWKVWIAAARPRTLPAAVAPVVVGSALAWRSGTFSAAASLLCLAFALLVQIGANFANDFFDCVHGADTGERVGPVRAVAAGLVPPAAMKRAAGLALGLAFFTGMGLVAWGGWWLVAVGAASIACAIAYTGGPYPLGYHGLGNVFVFIFFGLVAVGVTFYVQTGRITGAPVVAGAAVGALAANILLANNYRDAATDAKAGKRTVVVRFGKPFAQGQFAMAHLVAAAAPLALAALGLLRPGAAAGVAAVAVLCGFPLSRALRSAASPAECVGLLGKSSGYLTFYALLLSGAIVTG